MLRNFHSRRELLRAQAVSLIVFWCTLFYTLNKLASFNAVLKYHSDLAAFIGCCLVSMTYNTYLGLKHWPQVAPIGDGSGLFKKSPAAESIAVLQFSFQLWDLCAAFYVPGFLKVEMLVHHAVSERTLTTVADFLSFVLSSPLRLESARCLLELASF